MATRVVVTGAKGRMGSTAIETVRAVEGMELAIALDAKDKISSESLNAAGVAVDFSIPSVTKLNVHVPLDTGADVTVGTTGRTEESYERVHVHTEELSRAVLTAPNFAMGAVLAMKFTALAAPYFEPAEVVEVHHPSKVGTPSGTAITTARGIGATRKGTDLDSMPDATQSGPEGTRGGLIDGVLIHAVCLRGLTALGGILLGGPGEQLVIRTDSFDQVSFMPGVILAIHPIRGRVDLTVGLDKILDT